VEWPFESGSLFLILMKNSTENVEQERQRKFEKAIFVIGPTASGKTAFAHLLADRLHMDFGMVCELVNIDAFQFYRGVDIGAAKPSAEELRKYHYRGIDCLDALETIDAVQYARFVWDACQEIAAAGRLPICVGGSGLYLRAALHGLDELPPRQDEIRRMLRASADVWGWPRLHSWLNALAPQRASQLHPNDRTRIERALEIVLQLPDNVAPDMVFRNSLPLEQQPVVGDCYVIRVDCDDSVLKERISRRIDDMFAHGWVDEVQRLKLRWGPAFLASQAGKAIGYEEIYQALPEWAHTCEPCQATHRQTGGGDENVGQPRVFVSEALEKSLKADIATQTWQYVRRQRTWYAKERCDWFFETSLGIVDLQFDAQFLSFLRNHTI
jgi:tRNA dimethylallyltransferase